MQPFKHWCGVDYGSKLAGTTSICFRDHNGVVKVFQSEKKRDADEFLAGWLERERFDAVFIDAPLSLPLAYFDKAETDFLFRKADRAIQAMSPLFLGGLTARAIQFRHRFADVQFYESYPGGLIRHLEWTPMYSKKGAPQKALAKAMKGYLGSRIPTLTSMHEVDALMAWITGWRMGNGKAISVGDEREGLIWM